MSLTVVSASESVAHSEVASVGFRSEVIGSIPRPSAVVSPAVTAAIDGDKVRTAEVEVVSVGVAGVYSEPPVACVPVERAVEIECVAERAVLPVEQNIAQIQVALSPVYAEEVVLCAYAHQVVDDSLAT